jgi:hypothetical protein
MFVETNHQRQVTTCRVSRDKYFGRIASELFDMAKNPCHCSRRIFNVFGSFGSRRKPIIHANHTYIVILQGFGDFFASAGQSAAMKPYDRCETFFIRRVINIQFATLVDVWV